MFGGIDKDSINLTICSIDGIKKSLAKLEQEKHDTVSPIASITPEISVTVDEERST